MPSFYPNTFSRPMPLTPPDHYGMYPDNTGATQYPAINPDIHSAKAQGGGSGHEYTKRYPQFSMAPMSGPFYTKEYDRQSVSNYTAPPARTSANTHGPISAPLLPPIRVPDPSTDDYQSLHSKRTQPAAQPKEEKAIGGVAAYLDYEMDQMADFVAETAQGMYDLYDSRICLADIDVVRSVNPKTAVPPAFRKYVFQVLSSTRLPRTTILLGLYYLATRMTMLSASGRYTTGSGQVYRMLTTSLLLGSKFLDDNTFQNRSWSEVSNIPVAELNLLEIEWLLAIKWDMHVNPDDPQGFMLWQEQWEGYQDRKAIEKSLESLKLAPVDMNVRRQHSTNKRYSAAPVYQPLYNEQALGASANDHLHPQWSTPRYDQWPPTRLNTAYSPPSAPETGPNTPEWYGRLSGIGYSHGQQSYPARTIPPPSQILPSQIPQPAYQAPYPQQYNPSPWNPHGAHCGCGYCMPYQDRYSMAPGYGPQPVAG
jgi:hypothetical protein